MKSNFSILILLSLTFIISNCDSKPNPKPIYSDFENDWEVKNLYGKIKEYEELRKNNNETKHKIITKENFTERGAIIESKTYNSFGVIQQTSKYDYDSIKNLKTLLFETSNYKTEQKSIFDSIKKIEYQYVTINDSLKHQFIIRYNEKHNAIKQLKINKIDTLITNFSYKYNSDKKIKSIEKKSPNETVIEKFLYDKNGNIIENSTQTSFLTLRTTTEYKSNRIFKIKHFQGFPNEKEKLISITIYDENFNPIIEKSFENYKIVTELKKEYELDNVGNWIKKRVYIKEHYNNSNKFTYIYEDIRKIEYWN